MPATSSAVPGCGPLLRPTTTSPRPLAGLLSVVPGLTGPADPATAVTGCTLDSRTVRPGDLYAALPGAHVHGADFIAGAREAGAVAVLTDPAGAEWIGGADLPVLVAADPRAVLGDVAAWIYGEPARALTTYGITGTNGKTTTAFLVEAGLRAAGRTTGLIGTVQTQVAGDVLDSIRTTPEAPDLQALLAVMRERGVQAVAMEVSSHALSLGRVDGIVFDTAVFTNLSQDHLDFHASMAEYEAAKAQLFTPARSRRGVVNIDDPAGRRLVDAGAVPLVIYGQDGTWQATDIDLGPGGSRFRLRGPGVDEKASVRIPGAFNVTNALAALTALISGGLPAQAAVEGVAQLRGVPGRMESVDAGQAFTALVDYAHTPDAVSSLLHTVRSVTPGRVIVVLGCGGDRDRGKRPLMGAAAARGADLAVLTSDNPRSEDPMEILAAMTAGAPGSSGAVVVEPDRRTAMAHAVRSARPGDAVVVAGKGHETGQEIGGTVLPFDDRLVLRELIEQITA